MRFFLKLSWITDGCWRLLVRVMKGVAAMRGYQRVKEPLPHLERGWDVFEVLTLAVEAVEGR